MSTAPGGDDADRAARERLAGEARATAASVLDWLGSRVDGHAAPSDARPPQSAAPCAWCPVCALVAALRGEAPELTARTAEQVSGLLVLLRLMLQDHGGHQHAAPTPPSPDPPHESPDVPLHATFDPTPPAPWATAHDVTSPASTAGESASSPPPRSPAERPNGRRGPRPSPRRAPDPGASPAVAAASAGPGLADPVGGPAPGRGEPTGARRPPAAPAPPSSPSRGPRRVVQRIPIRRVAPPESC